MRVSATKVVQFSGCKHSVSLDLLAEKDSSYKRNAKDETLDLIAAQGVEFEKQYLNFLKRDYSVIEIPDTKGVVTDEVVNLTLDSMRAGVDFIYQAALFSNGEYGVADFLRKTNKPSKLGNFSYEILDTKLKSKLDPKYVFQLVFYSDILYNIQGFKPQYSYLILKNRDFNDIKSFTEEKILLSDVEDYARNMKSRLEDFIKSPPETKALPCSACDMCEWSNHCKNEWESNDSLVLIPGITADQIKKIEHKFQDLNIDPTVENIANFDQKIDNLNIETQKQIIQHAKLQVIKRQTNKSNFVSLKLEEGRGLNLLPEPQEGDMFYDIEGNPYHEEQGVMGLEYLNGIWFTESDHTFLSHFPETLAYSSTIGKYPEQIISDSRHGKFLAIWAHSRDEEKIALIKLFDFFEKRIAKYPLARIYHYAPYEITALKKLVQIHRYGEAQLDNWLREGRFVDLYKVVKGALNHSETAYSIKNMEAFYLDKSVREGDVKNGGESIIAYENWKANQDLPEYQHVIDGIRDYNKIDCESTMLLRDWLLYEVAPSDFVFSESSKLKDISHNIQEKEETHDAKHQSVLNTNIADDEKKRVLDLVDFFKREAKPAWWAVFERKEKYTDELIDDLESVGGLYATSGSFPEKRSLLRHYKFQPQETKLKKGDTAIVRHLDGLQTISIVDLNMNTGTATLKWGAGKGDLPDYLDLIPGGPIDASIIEEALWRFLDSYSKGENKFVSGIEVFKKNQPKFTNGFELNEVDEGELLKYSIDAIKYLDNSVLPIQGPPGTGKTYMTARAILELAEQGKKIGITSNSHKAIDNVLLGVVEAAQEKGVQYSVVKRGTDVDGDGAEFIQTVKSNSQINFDEHQIVGGTYWTFSDPRFELEFDYLIVDEAGQVGLPHILACSTSAKNIVLVGDPQQLPQPIIGTHPEDAGKSSLEYILQNQKTILTENGIFLPTSRRMHKEVCKFISEIAYENRLFSDDAANDQNLVVQSNQLLGVKMVPVEHFGNAQTSMEEIDAMYDWGQKLIGAEFTDRNGNVKNIEWKDILIVAPYNAQVNKIKEHLGHLEGIKIGTVDKFQGQEAPICFISMTTSSQNEMPRDLEFLFSLNRINVAISRAKAASFVFASPQLLEVHCNSVSKMKLVNAFCKIPQLNIDI